MTFEPIPFSISVREAKRLIMENSLDMWATDEFDKQGLNKSYYLVMYHDKATDQIVFYPIKTSWFWRLKTKLLDWFGIAYGVVVSVPKT